MRKRLLVVDGEPRSRRVLDVNLRGAGFDVQTASDGAQAWSLVETATPDLIVCDADSAEVDAFALCARLRASATASQVPFLLLSASRAREQKIRALEAGADDFLVKPAYLKEIVARARALLQRREREALATGGGGGEVLLDAVPEPSGRVGATPFSGDLAEISVVDLVQLVEHNGRSGIIHVRGPTGTPAFVYFRGGRVIDAEAGRLSGLDALARLFSWSAGTFEIEWKNIRRKDVVHRPPSELVLDGMQRLDAWNELRGALGNSSAVFEVDYRLLAERLAEIPDEVNGVLRLCDGVRTVLQVVEESSLSDAEALTALLRLREEGIVYDKAMPPPPTEEPRAPRRREGWSGAGQELMAAAAPRPVSRSSGASGPVERSGDDRRADGGVRPPESPRRTAPGLGGQTPTTGDDAHEPGPEPRPDGGAQSNVIQFPAPPGSPAADPAPLAARAVSTRAGPTVVGFVPVTTGLEPDLVARTEAAVSPAPAVTADELSLSMTLPLGRAQDVAALREQVLRERSAPPVAPAEDAAPQALASMADTHRGFGASPPASNHEGSPAAGVPIEVVESTSGPPMPSGPISAPTPGQGPSLSGRVRTPTAEGAGPGTAVSGETHSRSAGSGPHAAAMVPPPSDATAKVSFADADINRHDALDELGLPSRWRGFRVMVGALLLGAGAAVGAHRFLRARVDHRQDPPVSAEPAGTAAPLPRGPVVAPVTEPAPAPSAPPVVELPTPSAPIAPAEDHRPPAPVAAAPSPPAHGDPAAESPERALAAPPSVPAAAPAPATPAPNDTLRAEAGPAPGAGAGSENTPAPGGKELNDCRAAFARGRLREALAACTSAVAANPRSAGALTMLAHTELNRGRLARANELAEKAIAIDPDQADAYVIIGGVHQDSGQNREAKAAYRRYLELAPRGRYADELRSIVNGL